MGGCKVIFLHNKKFFGKRVSKDLTGDVDKTDNEE